MDNMVIQRHSFDLAKNRLKEFSERTEEELKIGHVETEGGFLWLGDHKVTGYELNQRIENIQENFIAINDTNKKVIEEFGEIYNALDALDKEYLTSIICNIKAIEKTSNDVRRQQGTLKQHSEKLERQQSKLDEHQDEIERNVANLSKVVVLLKSFKEKLEKYEHLIDIDKIWSDHQEWHREVLSLSDYVFNTLAKEGKENASGISNVRKLLKDTEGNVEELSKILREQINRIQKLNTFINELKSMPHLKKVENMWGDLSNTMSSLKKLTRDLETLKKDIVIQKRDIAKVLDFVESLSKCKHLKDVDIMWNKIESNDVRLDDLFEKDKTMFMSIENLREEQKAFSDRGEEMSLSIIENQRALRMLEEYKQKLEIIVHLKEIDDMWKSSEKNSVEIENLQNQSKEIKERVQENREFTEQTFKNEKKENVSVFQQLNKKIQYAYLIAGGSMALAIVELFLIFSR